MTDFGSPPPPTGFALGGTVTPKSYDSGAMRRLTCLFAPAVGVTQTEEAIYDKGTD